MFVEPFHPGSEEQPCSDKGYHKTCRVGVAPFFSSGVISLHSLRVRG